ncbi:MAG: hypothetical protein AB1576_13365 [Bacillota bacterium]
MDEISRALARLGLPTGDRYDLPSSPLAFPDGGQCRIEIAGVERASAMEALARESDARGVPVHRVISTVGGATFLDKAELRDLAQAASGARVEVIVTLGPRRSWDTGRQIATSEGLVSGMRIRGADNAYYYLKDMERCLNAGFRGFLVADEGMMWLLKRLREEGSIPQDTIFKVSVFAGHANPFGARLIEELGANSFNPLADLSIPMLAAIRQSVRLPLDLYVHIVQSMGGFVRYYEAHEMARVCAPCYFKFEPGESEEYIYHPWNTQAFNEHRVREKVRFASIMLEIMQGMNSEIRWSQPGAEDLAIPKLP